MSTHPGEDRDTDSEDENVEDKLFPVPIQDESVIEENSAVTQAAETSNTINEATEASSVQEANAKEVEQE